MTIPEQANFDISNSDISHACEILLKPNSVSQLKKLSRTKSWLWGLFLKVQITRRAN